MSINSKIKGFITALKTSHTNCFEGLEGDNLNINLTFFKKLISGTYVQIQLTFKRSLWEQLMAKLSYVFLVGVNFLRKL